MITLFNLIGTFFLRVWGDLIYAGHFSEHIYVYESTFDLK